MRALFGIAIAVALFAAPARAEIPDWAPPSKGEVAALVAVESLIALDMAQTLKFVRSNPTNACEFNPLLGCHPSAAKVVGMAGAGALLTAVIWYVAPPKMRYIVTGLVGTGEILAVSNNMIYAHLGFGF
jgi:hypothetical protein